MKRVDSSGTDQVFLCDPSEPDLFIRGLSGAFEGNMKEAFGRVIVRNNWWDFAIGLSLHRDRRVAFRGSWALEWAYYSDKETFRPYANRFLDNFLKTQNPSVHRIYAKMLLDMCHRKIITLNDIQAEAVAEKSFGLLIEPDTKPAVMAWCMELLYDLSPRLDWTDEPLREMAYRIMENDTSKAMARFAGRLLKRMDKRRKSTCGLPGCAAIRKE